MNVHRHARANEVTEGIDRGILWAMFARWRGRASQVSLLGRVYLLVAALVVLLGIVAIGTVWSRKQTENAVSQLTTTVVPAEIAVNGLITAYSEQDNAVRGFLLTRDPAFLGNYSTGQATTYRLEGIIGQQLNDDPEAIRLLDEVRGAARVWRQESLQPHLPPDAPPEAGQPPPASFEEKQRFDALRSSLATLHSRINDIATDETSEANAVRTTTNWLVAITGAGGLVLAVTALLLLRRSLTRPLRTLVSQVNQVAVGDLDRPVRETGPTELTTVARAVEMMRTRILTETRRATRMQEDLARHEEAERQRAERDFATVVAALDEGVIVIGAGGTIESANPSAERILGASTAELVGSAPDSWALFDEAGNALGSRNQLAMPTRRTGRPETSRVVRLDRADGTGVWLAVTSRVLNEAGGPPYMAVTSFTDITESRAARQRLEYEAVHDPLTGLANRTLILRHLDPAERSRQHPLAVLFVDLDNFKFINDSLGHGVGDEVLRGVGQRLNRAAPENALVGRIGGDEFVVLVEETDRRLLARVGDRLLAALGDPLRLDGRQLHVGGSIGMLISPPEDARTGQELLRDADVAMYQAKTRGGGCYAFFDVELREGVQRRMALEQDLRQAVPRDQLWVACQPIVDLSTERPVGVESLLRWTHPAHGEVSPAEFIPLAEESGLINTVGAHMLRSAVRQLAELRSRYGRELRLNANLSPRQLEDPDLQPTVERALAEADLPGSALCLEITEGAIMREPAAAARVLNSLRELGISLAIDDFGTGYSSLAQLRQLPLDSLKIDRSFVSDLGASRELEVLVISIVTMAHALELAVVAEGVETRQQLDVLERIGCDQAQGYHFGRPVPAAEVFSQGAGLTP